MKSEWRDFGGTVAADYSENDAKVSCPCGCVFFVSFNGPELCPRCEREYKAEASVRVYVRVVPDDTPS